MKENDGDDRHTGCGTTHEQGVGGTMRKHRWKPVAASRCGSRRRKPPRKADLRDSKRAEARTRQAGNMFFTQAEHETLRRRYGKDGNIERVRSQ